MVKFNTEPNFVESLRLHLKKRKDEAWAFLLHQTIFANSLKWANIGSTMLYAIYQIPTSSQEKKEIYYFKINLNYIQTFYLKPLWHKIYLGAF